MDTGLGSRGLLGVFVVADGGDESHCAQGLWRRADALAARGARSFIGYLATQTSSNLGFVVLRTWCLLLETLKSSQIGTRKGFCKIKQLCQAGRTAGLTLEQAQPCSAGVLSCPCRGTALVGGAQEQSPKPAFPH